jgi:hypothetical protein
MVTTALDWFEATELPPGSNPFAIAVLLTTPASTSACVTAYVAEHVVSAPGARLVAKQLIADNVPVPEKEFGAVASSMLIPCTVTFPLLCTANEYVTESPAADTDVGVTDFTNVRAGAAASVMVTVEGVEDTAPPAGGRADAVAVLVTCPASTSAWVVT